MKPGRKRGRPALDPSDPSVTLTIRLPSKEFDALARRAARPPAIPAGDRPATIKNFQTVGPLALTHAGAHSMLTRAFAHLEIKSYDLDTREIEGIATTPTADRRGDVVECGGAEFTLPLPLLWQHNQADPVGEVYEAQVTPAGIRIKARFAKVDEPGLLRDRLDYAWQSVKAKLVRGLSIGFKPLDLVPLRKGDPSSGFHIKRWLWAELSAVTIPMNVEASILNIKSAAREGRPMQTYSEQITALETSRAAALASMTDLMAKAAESGTTLGDAGQGQEYDTQSTRVKSIDADLTRLRELEALNVIKAVPVPAVPTPRAPVIQVKSNVAPGTAFVRYAMSLVNGRGDTMRAMEFAKRFNDSTPEVELMVKAAVLPGDTLNPSWAGALVQMRNATEEFLVLLRPATILGKIPGFKRVPFNTQVPVQTGGGTYKWVGQGASKPVGKLGLTTIGLGFSKAAGIIVITEELAKLSSPSAEGIVRDDMIAGMAAFLDQQLIDPAVALVANVSPASITNGADTAASSDDPYIDLHTIASHFATNQLPLAGLTLIMSETNALTAGMLKDPQGNKVFPGLAATGGSAEGFTVIASNAAGTNVIGIHPNGVLYADEGGVEIDVSREASVVMDDAPVSGTGVLRSFWQDNLVGLRAERMINWNRARPKSVFYLTGAQYVPTAPAAGLGAAGRGGNAPVRNGADKPR